MLIFFFNDTPTTEIYTLSLHDALPIFDTVHRALERRELAEHEQVERVALARGVGLGHHRTASGVGHEVGPRSEEHTSELQSRQYLVCRLLLEKKKQSRNRLE